VTLASAFRRGIDAIYQTAGVAATYTDRAGAQSSVTVIVEHSLGQYGEQAEVLRANAAISVRVSEVASRPRKGDTFVAGGTAYTVADVQSSNELEHVALVT